jgi:LPS-assembly protein
MTRRGAGLDTEFRYLEPEFKGRIDLNLLPNDRVAHRDRQGLQFEHDGRAWGDVFYSAYVRRVSDDTYWKDFPRAMSSITPRLLIADLKAERPWSTPFADGIAYARVQTWQVLNQATDVGTDAYIVPPYDRAPQVGVRGSGRVGQWGVAGLEYAVETEINRFQLAEGRGTSAQQPTDGTRVHALGSVSLPIALPGGWITPKLALNAASYRFRYDDDLLGREQRGSGSRTIPTFSIDSGLVLERQVRWLGRDYVQTLEPRVLYVNTPLRRQQDLPNFDAAGKDFNDISVFSDNAFAGVDRVSDAHQVTAGAISRWIEPGTGAEAMRLGIAQRWLLRDQQITPEGVPLTQRFSDLLMLGSATLSPRWTFGSTVQYSPELSRVRRALIGGRYSPGPFRTLNLNYRYTRDASEQVEVGWQWPLYGAARDERGRLATSSSGATCGSGTWYTVGRVNYSTRDRRMTDSIAGFEYDAGCWIGRVVAERLSTGRSEATTRLMFQLELVGLSRLGSNPLRSLKDNIPGYRLLREDR